MDLLRFDPGIFRIGIACAAMALATMARASESGFSDGLSPGEKAACGISRLTATEVTALNALVGRDVTLARQGGVTGFSSAFAARHTAQELSAAGIGRLSEKERSSLDSLVARAMALGPSPLRSFEYVPPPPAQPVVPIPAPQAPEVHGDLTLTIGGGRGSSFYGSSVDLFITDPSGRFTLGVGVSDYRGRGYFGPYGPYCSPYAGPFLPFY
jgi:hypothetical protein